MVVRRWRKSKRFLKPVQKLKTYSKPLLQDEIVSSSKETALLIQYAEFVRDYLHVLRSGDKANLASIYETFKAAWDDYGFC